MASAAAAAIDTPADRLTKRQRCDRLVAQLKNDRSSFESHWRDLAEYFKPRRTRWWVGDRNKGDRRNLSIINSTGIYAARTLASGMHAGLTSPARPWLRLTTPDPDLAQHGPVKQWLYDVTQRMLTVFAEGNLYTQLPTVYGDMGVFGSAALAILEDRRDLFRASSYPIGSYWVGYDGRGMPSTFAREYEMTVAQVVEQFLTDRHGNIDWTRASRTLKAAWDAGTYEQAVAVSWVIAPNRDGRSDRLEAKYLPFASSWYETAASEALFLRESGFRSFPIMAPRWDVTDGDSYGTECPGMIALGDNRQLQVMERKAGQLLAKAVDPPLVGPSSLRTQKTSLVAGDITYNDSRDGMQGLRPIHEVQLQALVALEQKIGRVEARIIRACFADLFQMLQERDDETGSSQPLTATEVRERHEEKLLALGPVVERTDDELLDPLVDRVFDLMVTSGLVPTWPAELDGVPLKVEYISILSEAQKLAGVVVQDRFLQSVAQLATVWPEALSKVDPFEAVERYGRMLGPDPAILVDTDQAKQIVAARQQAAQQQAASEQALNLARATHAAGNTPMGTDSALDRVVSAVGAQAA